MRKPQPNYLGSDVNGIFITRLGRMDRKSVCAFETTLDVDIRMDR